MNDVYRLGIRARMQNMQQNVRYSIRASKPRLWPRICKKAFQAFVLRQAPLRQIEIALDYRCNLRCPHCSSLVLQKTNRPLMDHGDYRALAADLRNSDIVSIIFTGGEPLYFFDKLLSVLPIFHPERHLISIQSNTVLLTEDTATKLKAAGVDLVLGSIDSFHAREETNEDLLHQADRTIAIARRNGLDMTYCTVITHSNIKSEGLRMLIEFMRVRNVLLFFNIAVPVGEWTGNTDIILTPEDQQTLRELTRSHPHTRFDFGSNFGGFGCPAFKERFYITPYGDILGCPFLQISFGNLREGATIAGARSAAMQNPFFMRYHEYCLAGEDPAFMAAYIPKYNQAKTLPLSYDDLKEEILHGWE